MPALLCIALMMVTVIGCKPSNSKPSVQVPTTSNEATRYVGNLQNDAQTAQTTVDKANTRTTSSETQINQALE